MRLFALIIGIVFIALPAIAGDEVWTPSTISKGGQSTITIDSGTTIPFSSPLIETRLCSSVVLHTDDADATYDVQLCRSGDASSCFTRNATSPLNAATNPGVEIATPGYALRLVIQSDATTNATFAVDCNP